MSIDTEKTDQKLTELSAQTTKKLTFKPIFNKLDVPKKERKFIPKKKIKVPVRKETAYEKKFSHIKPVVEGFVFPVGENSFRQFLSQCHPDVRKLVGDDEIKKIKTIGHGIEICTISGLRIEIKIISKLKQEIFIYEKRKKIFQGISQVHFTKQ